MIASQKTLLYPSKHYTTKTKLFQCTNNRNFNHNYASNLWLKPLALHKTLKQSKQLTAPSKKEQCKVPRKYKQSLQVFWYLPILFFVFLDLTFELLCMFVFTTLGAMLILRWKHKHHKSVNLTFQTPKPCAKLTMFYLLLAISTWSTKFTFPLRRCIHISP